MATSAAGAQTEPTELYTGFIPVEDLAPGSLVLVLTGTLGFLGQVA